MEEGFGHLRRSHLLLILTLIILTGVSIRFYRLRAHSLWVDEVITLDNSYIGSSLAPHILDNLQGPIVSALIHFWGRLGMREDWLRLPFAVAGALTVWVTYRLARLVSDLWRSLHTVLLVALSPMLIWYSQEIRGYAFALLFVILMTYYFMKWLREPTPRSLALYGLFFYLALLSNLSSSFIGLAHFLYLLSSHLRRRLLGRWVVASLVVMLLFSPWIQHGVERMMHSSEPLQQHSAPIGGARLTPYVIPYLFYAYSVGYTLGPSTGELKHNAAKAVRENIAWILITAAVFGIPVLMGVKRMISSDPNLAVFILIWLVITTICAVGLAAAGVKVFTPRYTLVALPAYAFLFGHGLSTMSRKAHLVLLIAALGLWSISNTHYLKADPRYARDDAREASKRIMENFQPGDSVLAFFSAEPLSDYYLNDSVSVAVFGAKDIRSPEAMIERCKKITSGAKRVWLYLCREEMIDREGIVRSWFEKNLVQVKSWERPNLRLYLYEKESKTK